MTNPLQDLELRAVLPTEGTVAIDVLEDGFHDDPTLRWCFFGDRPGYRGRLRAYLEAGHAWHVAARQPVHGAFLDGRMIGVLYAMTPDVETTREDVERLERAMLDGCGADAVERFAAYNQATEAHAPEEPHHVLALVAVLEPWRGRGAGSRLVDGLHRVCDRHPTSRGVLLDTGRQRNIGFYRSHGYDEVARLALGELVERVMWRERGASRG